MKILKWLFLGFVFIVAFRACSRIDEAARSPSASQPAAVRKQPPQPETPAQAAAREQAASEVAALEAAKQKHLERWSSLDQMKFCSTELPKIRNEKQSAVPGWLAAVEARAADGGVTGPHLFEIRRKSVVVGMTRCGAVAAWGRPEDVNRTTNAIGTHEQWVYGSGNYLYFNEDRLTTIQN